MLRPWTICKKCKNNPELCPLQGIPQPDGQMKCCAFVSVKAHSSGSALNNEGNE